MLLLLGANLRPILVRSVAARTRQKWSRAVLPTWSRPFSGRRWKATPTSEKEATPSSTRATVPRREGSSARLQEAVNGEGCDSVRDVVYVGIDPDLGGALAALRVAVDEKQGALCKDSPSEILKHNGGERSPSALEVNGCDLGEILLHKLKIASVELHDMPCVKVQVGKTLRRRPDLDAIVDIAQLIRSWAQGTEVIVCIEQPRPQPTNGALSCYSVGLSFGMWCAAMRSQGFTVIPIEPMVWKKDMNLWRKDKESSRQFALEIFPQLAERMKRKKDHGRAEALLITTWSIWTIAQGSKAVAA